MSGPLRVLLADAAPLHRAGLRTVLTGSTPIATNSTPLPAGRTPLPTNSTPLPAGGTPIATNSTPLPAGRTPLPTNSTPLPAGGTSLPAGKTPLLAGQTPLPAGSSPTRASRGTASTDDHGWAGGQREIVIAGEAGDGVEAVDLARRLLPDVLIADVALPRQDGLAVARAITEARLAVRVLILTSRDTDEEVFAAIAAGAAGYLCKEAPQAELVAAVHAVADGGAVITPQVLARMLTRMAGAMPPDSGESVAARLSPLTGREREVLVHVARGRNNGEIAAILGVSETTVKTHVGHVLTKLRLRDRTQAVILAYETGLIRPGM
ncbi:LuxR C-terminal-related transcriptional regulator [Actinoplanes subglobosus]|uniref:LuxR C-terminal-related transcriptional regulator n=1 Tax=Actinoplanes subglobosus TaxID=1547892 RepID=A0ABV8IQY6_9ACTN